MDLMYLLDFPGSSVERVHLPMLETWVWSLGWKDPLEKETTTYSNILAWEILWTEEPGGSSPGGHKRVGHDLMTK